MVALRARPRFRRRKWAFDAGIRFPRRQPSAEAPFISGRGTAILRRRCGNREAAVEMATGALMAWAWGHESGDVYTSSPTFLDGVVYFGAVMAVSTQSTP